MSIKPRGHYGLNKLYKVAGHPVGYRIRTEDRELFYAGRYGEKKPNGNGVFLFSRRLPARFAKLNQLNEDCETRNLAVISGLPKEKPCVLYVLDFLFKTGGVERRLALQFKWLRAHGILPVLVVEKQDYEPLKDYPCLFLNQEAPNAGRKLLEFVKRIRPAAVEFNVKSTDFLHDVDVNALKALTRVGVMIHNLIDADQERMDALDYRCIVRKHERRYKHLTYVPNAVVFPDVVPSYRPEARKALYIGRIDEEKLPTLKNFVEICRRYGMSFEIAGPVYQEGAVTQWAESLPDGVMLGVIDTRSFLPAHGEEYAFIAGVGQVALEAAAVNLPCLVTTHLPNAMRSAFLTRDNLARLLDWNCVLRLCPEDEVEGNVPSFFEVRSRAEEEPQALDAFRVRSQLMALRNEDEIWSKYCRVMMGTAEGQQPVAEAQ